MEKHSDHIVNFRADHLKKHIVSHVNNTIPLQMSAPLLGGGGGGPPEVILELISKGGMTIKPQ